MKHRLSDRERDRRARQRAMSVSEFAQRYGIGRSKAYAEIAARRLRALKVGKRTLITEDDAEIWLRRLPVMGGSRDGAAEQEAGP